MSIKFSAYTRPSGEIVIKAVFPSGHTATQTTKRNYPFLVVVGYQNKDCLHNVAVRVCKGTSKLEYAEAYVRQSHGGTILVRKNDGMYLPRGSRFVSIPIKEYFGDDRAQAVEAYHPETGWRLLPVWHFITPGFIQEQQRLGVTAIVVQRDKRRADFRISELETWDVSNQPRAMKMVFRDEGQTPIDGRLDRWVR